MDHAAILERVIALTSEELECDPAGLSEDTEFKSLDANSFDLLELIIAIEDEFGIPFDDEKPQSIVSIADVVRVIEATRAEETS